MPSLNQARFIGQAIDSVLSQPEVDELIVMDGGSSDGTQDVLETQAAKYRGRLRWTSEPDRGPAHALNKALRQARGTIIGWLNADDIYTAGAVARATEVLERNPVWLMVYGQAHHLDESGKVLGDYPTRKPDTPVEGFAEGCFICQPTVFLLRQAVEKLGELDEGLKTAFDFDWWLRLFTQYPERIGFVDRVQAGSRLHSNCITLHQRATVIREGMQVLARYLGHAPLTWVKTYVDEILEQYPHGRPISNIKQHLQDFSKSIHDCLCPEEQQALQDWLNWDARINLAQEDAYLHVYPDGWLSPHSELRIRAKQNQWKAVQIVGRHVSDRGPLNLKFTFPTGHVLVEQVTHKGTFVLTLPLQYPATSESGMTIAIKADGGFIPAQESPRSSDGRELVCMIEAVRLIKPPMHKWVTWGTITKALKMVLTRSPARHGKKHSI